MVSYISLPTQNLIHDVSSNSSFSVISNKNEINSPSENVIEKIKFKVENDQKFSHVRPLSETFEQNQCDGLLNTHLINSILNSQSCIMNSCFQNFPFLFSVNNKKKPTKKLKKSLYTISKTKNMKKICTKAKKAKVFKLQKKKSGNFSNNHSSITIQDAPKQFMANPSVVTTNGSIHHETFERRNEQLESNSIYDLEDVMYILNSPPNGNRLRTRADDLTKVLLQGKPSNYHNDEEYNLYKPSKKLACYETTEFYNSPCKTPLFSSSPFNDKIQGTLQDAFFNSRIQKLIYSNKLEGFAKNRNESRYRKKRKISFVSHGEIDTSCPKTRGKTEFGENAETSEAKCNFEREERTKKEVTQQNELRSRKETKTVQNTPENSFKPKFRFYTHPNDNPLEREMSKKQRMPSILSKYFRNFPKMAGLIKENVITPNASVSDDLIIELPYQDADDFDSRLLHNSHDQMMEENKENDFICIDVAGLSSENKNLLKKKFKYHLDHYKHSPEYINHPLCNKDYIKHHRKPYVSYNDYGRSYSSNSFNEKNFPEKHKLEKWKSESDILSCSVASNCSCFSSSYFQKKIPIMRNQHTMTYCNTVSETSVQTQIDYIKIKNLPKSSKCIQVESPSFHSKEESNVDPAHKSIPFVSSYEEVLLNETHNLPEETNFVHKNQQDLVNSCPKNIPQSPSKPQAQTPTHVLNWHNVPMQKSKNQKNQRLEIKNKFFDKIDVLSQKNQALIKELTGNVSCYEKLVKDTFDILLARPDVELETNDLTVKVQKSFCESTINSHEETKSFQSNLSSNQLKETVADSKPPDSKLKLPSNLIETNVSTFNQTAFLFQLLTLVKSYQDQQQKLQNEKEKLREKEKKLKKEKKRQKSLKTQQSSGEITPFYNNNSSKSLFNASETSSLTRTRKFSEKYDINDHKRIPNAPIKKLENLNQYAEYSSYYPNIYRQENISLVPQKISKCQHILPQMPHQHVFNTVPTNNNNFSDSFYKNAHNGNQSNTSLSRTSLNNSFANMLYPQQSIEPCKPNCSQFCCRSYNNIDQKVDKNDKVSMKSKKRRKKRKRCGGKDSELSLIEKLDRMKNERKKLKKNEKTLEMLNTFLALKVMKGKEKRRKFARYY